MTANSHLHQNKRYRRGQILTFAGGFKVRILNPLWPLGTEPFCEAICR